MGSMIYDAGLFELDDDVQKVLPFEVRNPSFKKVPITYRMIYEHKTGLKSKGFGWLDGQDCPKDKPHPMDLLTSVEKATKGKKRWYNVKPGTYYSYSNYSTMLAALLVERHSGYVIYFQNNLYYSSYSYITIRITCV